jgi:hypothetical protein
MLFVPRQLPSAAAHFTGRDDEMRALSDMVDQVISSSGTTFISAISGTAGVGKTALALHLAHSVAHRFPDGQLYIDLRGYDADRPVDPIEGLGMFLRALGTDPDDIPSEVAERGALYRTLMADRQMLVLLDNAKSTEHIRLLLPGSQYCLTLVTSRDSLAGLVARHGAARIDLDVLPPDEAAALLRALIGDRENLELDNLNALADQCSRLPLALRIAAELLASRSDRSLTRLIDQLADEHCRLDLLSAGGDTRTAVRTVFSWSYRQLPEPAARAFRLLGLLPDTEIDSHAVAALAKTTPQEACVLLEPLARASLIQRVGEAKYRMHNLLRVYAMQLFAEHDEADRDEPALIGSTLLHHSSVTLMRPRPNVYKSRLLGPLTGETSDDDRDHRGDGRVSGSGRLAADAGVRVSRGA